MLMLLSFLLSSRSSFLTDFMDLFLAPAALRCARRRLSRVSSCLVRVVLNVFRGIAGLCIAFDGASDGLLTRPGGIVEGKLSEPATVARDERWEHCRSVCGPAMRQTSLRQTSMSASPPEAKVAADIPTVAFVP